MMLLTGLPVAGTVIILVFGCLCRKTNLRGREDTMSGTEKQSGFSTVFEVGVAFI